MTPLESEGSRVHSKEGRLEAVHRHARKQSGRSRLVAFVVIVVIGGVLLLAGRPIYIGLAHWQSDNLLSQAEELTRQQMFTEAIERLEVSLQLNPGSPEALRLLASIYTRFELPYALPVWRTLLTLPEHSDKDIHNYIDLALKLQRFDLAEAQLARLLARARISPQTRRQAGEYFFRQGDFPRALQFAEQLREDDPTNRLHQLRIAQILLNLPDPASQKKGTDLLLSLENPTQPEMKLLLRVLAEARDLSEAGGRRLVTNIVLPESAAQEEFFLLADVRLRLLPEDREKIISEAIQRYARGTPIHKAGLCSWLNRTGEPNRVLELLGRGPVPEDPPLAMAYFEALALARHWKAIEDATNPTPPLEVWMLAALRAVAAENLGQASRGRDQWRRAFEDVAGSPNKARALGDLALKLNAVDRAIEAYQYLTRDRLTRVVGFRLLAQTFERLDDPQRLRAIMREWSAQVPDDPLPDNAFCYMSGLLQSDVDLAHERARKLHERLPRRLAYRTTLALLELRRNRPQAALQLFHGIRPEIDLRSPQARLVYAAVLNANGQTATARDLVQELRTRKFFPQEWELLQQIHGN